MRSYSAVTHHGALARESININWCLTNICNFSCRYCPPTLHSGTQRGLEFRVVANIIDEVTDHYLGKKKFFEFTGGEVTYYKRFLDIAKHVRSRGAGVGIISNGKRDLTFWQKLRPYLDHICLSYHPEAKYSEHFLEVVSFLNEATTVHVNVMMMPELFNDCVDLANQVCSVKGTSLALQPLYVNMTGKKFAYDAQQTATLEKQIDALPSKLNYAPGLKGRKAYRGPMRFETPNGEYDIYSTPEILAKGLNNWQGWHCYAGLENLVIDMEGNIRRAWCQSSGVSIGNILTGFSFPDRPVVCSVTNCHCGFDMMCTKVRPGNAAEKSR